MSQSPDPSNAQALSKVTLSDRYTQTSGSVFLSGNQALVRLPMQQQLLDERAGLHTSSFISGYRGSPLGRYDMELWSVKELLEKHRIHFQPGVNEDLAATAVWGTQHAGNTPAATTQGVVGYWYGKGPGVDRSGDVFRHANLAGTNAKGGVLAFVGDDHAAKSSTTSAQSDPSLIAASIPVLAPSNVQEILDFGLIGIAMSRFSGCWVAMKLVTDVVESASSVDVSLERLKIVVPPAPDVPGGVHIRVHDMPLMQEARMVMAKLPMATGFARANGLNRIVFKPESPRVGIVAAGKSYADVRQAMTELGLSQQACEAAGVRLLKIGMVWPLEPEIVKSFAQGLQAILVVEEKRALIEDQIKTILYDAGVSPAPKIIGKSALPGMGELSPNIVAHGIAKILGRPEMAAHIALPTAMKFGPDGRPILGPMRLPSFCSGCPHSSSIKVPEGSRALAGIGCHGMAVLNSPQTTMMISHMGGEGVMWVGQAPYTKEAHIFANMGDGTYFHSGFMAIRQAVAAKANMTYKLLVNGFVSMTGGQPIDGELSVPRIIRSLQAEGVNEIVIVTDDVQRVIALGIPEGVPVHPREELDAVQRRLRAQGGTTVLIYDQPCATELRRQRKRGTWADPDIRSYIAPEVCEGCGDCGDQSGCLSIEPLETAMGRKRRINQSSCNKDFSCVNGFCPSFVTVAGARPRRSKGAAAQTAAALIAEQLPLPEILALERPLGILFTGIGGTGVVTVGAIVSMAAHLDGKAVSSLDVTGLAQKFGTVMTHMRIASDASQLHSARLAMGEADVVIGCDLLASAGDEALSRLRPDSARLVLNSEEVPTFAFSKDPDWNLNVAELKARLDAKAPGRYEMVDASELARQLLGDAVLANTLLLGFAWQKGWIPVSWAALVRAVELNGVAHEANLAALQWGRLLVIAPQRVEANIVTSRAKASAQSIEMQSGQLQDLLADRRQRLVAYQNQTLADAYDARLQPLHAAPEALQREAATQYFRLLADKDEFEVARLYTEPAFLEGLNAAFEGDMKINFHLGGGPFGKKDPITGQNVKTRVGPWMMSAFKLLAGLRSLRGSLLDPFRNSPERKLAIKLRTLYEQDMVQAAALIEANRFEAAQQLLSWPRTVRGFGHVRARNAQLALKQREGMLASDSPTAPAVPATPSAATV